MKVIKNNYLLILLLVISIITIIPFFHPGFFSFHDDTQVQRVFQMKVALMDGVFPVRWVKDLGYGLGYPIYNFYGPFPYYVGAFFAIVGLDALLATKLMIALAMLASAFSMYFLAKEFWGKMGGMLSALMYVFAPYLALNVYVRGAIGEVYAFFFAPLIFFSLWKYYKTSSFSYIVLGVLSFAGLIISHNLSAMMLTPFVVLASIFLFFSKKNYLIFLIPILGILLSSFYAIPALMEMKFTNVYSVIGGGSDFRDHFVCPIQLWSSPWMYGGSVPGCIDGLSFRLGKLHLILAFIPIFFAAYYFKKDKLKSIIVFITSTFLILSIFLTLEWSRFIWEFISFMEFFQFPWRFLLAASLFSSFLSGSVIYYLYKIRLLKNKKFNYLIFIVIIISTIFLYSKLFVPQAFEARTADYYTNENFLNWDTSKISDEYMPPNFNKPNTSKEIIKNKISGNNIKLIKFEQKTNQLSAVVSTNVNSKIIIHIPYFPAWRFYVNGEKEDFEISDSGVLLNIPKGESLVEARFEQTNIEKFANLISISSILVLLIGIIYYKQKRKNEKNHS